MLRINLCTSIKLVLELNQNAGYDGWICSEFSAQ